LGSCTAALNLVVSLCVRSEHAAPSHAELAEIRRRRPGVRASLACEGMYLTAEEEALFDEMDRERLSSDECAKRIIEFSRAKRRKKALASS
jgi:hypothetical protein